MTLPLRATVVTLFLFAVGTANNHSKIVRIIGNEGNDCLLALHLSLLFYPVS